MDRNILDALGFFTFVQSVFLFFVCLGRFLDRSVYLEAKEKCTSEDSNDHKKVVNDYEKSFYGKIGIFPYVILLLLSFSLFVTLLSSGRSLKEQEVQFVFNSLLMLSVTMYTYVLFLSYVIHAVDKDVFNKWIFRICSIALAYEIFTFALAPNAELICVRLQESLGNDCGLNYIFSLTRKSEYWFYSPFAFLAYTGVQYLCDKISVLRSEEYALSQKPYGGKVGF